MPMLQLLAMHWWASLVVQLGSMTLATMTACIVEDDFPCGLPQPGGILGELQGSVGQPSTDVQYIQICCPAEKLGITWT